MHRNRAESVEIAGGTLLGVTRCKRLAAITGRLAKACRFGKCGFEITARSTEATAFVFETTTVAAEATFARRAEVTSTAKTAFAGSAKTAITTFARCMAKTTLTGTGVKAAFARSIVKTAACGRTVTVVVTAG